MCGLATKRKQPGKGILWTTFASVILQFLEEVFNLYKHLEYACGRACQNPIEPEKLVSSCGHKSNMGVFKEFFGQNGHSVPNMVRFSGFPCMVPCPKVHFMCAQRNAKGNEQKLHNVKRHNLQSSSTMVVQRNSGHMHIENRMLNRQLALQILLRVYTLLPYPKCLQCGRLLGPTP